MTQKKKQVLNQQSKEKGSNSQSRLKNKFKMTKKRKIQVKKQSKGEVM